MANYTASRLGQAGGSGAEEALFLKVFAGEVLTAFKNQNIMMPLHSVRTIKNGKSAQFPMTGVATADYHTAGNEITGGAIQHNEKVITIDDLLISSAFIANIDEAMNHYDVRSTYSKEIGNALAQVADKNILKVIGAATTDETNYVGQGQRNNTDITIAGSAAAGTDIANAIFAALQALDEKNVTGEKYVVVTPAIYYTLFNQGSAGLSAVMNKDFGTGGNVNTGTVPTIGGAKVFMSNNIPTTDTTSADTTPNPTTGNDYNTINFSGTKGFVFTKEAAATVKLLDLGVESEYQIQRQGTLMVAKYAMGHDSLRPECAVKLI